MQDLPGPAILKTICETPLLANVSRFNGQVVRAPGESRMFEADQFMSPEFFLFLLLLVVTIGVWLQLALLRTRLTCTADAS